ncbi:ABC transporter ATP-binding protein [Ideonella sp. B508-1]|uniref:ABC transporter ATP-binding protein n=1 Tax=Ideonella sp. B508-1 TaxID=137716 RepID=UPI0003466458|nr:ABC transporter ATP-binding protein [Ideonella sp. B508-1]
MSGVSLRGIQKRYGQTEIIRGIDLEIADGEFMVFVGPSGCGKSTLLRMIAGLEDITAGELLIGGRRANDIRPADRGVAMVFQSYALYPHMTVAENMGFALRMAGVGKAERETQVGRAAEVLRLSHLLPRYPKELSGGQRQRVAIGRAIVRKPQVFLFDEPLSNLDASLRVDMRIELSRLHAELGTTMIYVTHDQVEAMTLGHRIALFNQGLIEQCGAPLELYQRPSGAFTAGFLGTPRINLISRPQDDASTALKALWAACVPQEQRLVCQIGLRPEHIGVCAHRSDAAQAAIELVEQLGDCAILHLRVAGLDDLLRARLDTRDAQALGDLSPGRALSLEPDAAKTLRFGEQGRLLPDA